MEIKPIRILLIEYKHEHIALAEESLSSLQDQYSIDIARSFETARNYLKTNKYDIALSRFLMPDGNLVKFLKIQNNNFPFPFLVIADPADELNTIEAVSAGAFYYKIETNDFFHRMPVIIERCIREWNYMEGLKNAENEKNESEAKYSMLVEKSKDGVIIVQDEKFKFANTACTKISGYTVEELTDMPVITLLSNDYKHIFSVTLQMFLSGREIPETVEAKIIRKDGTLRDIEISASLIQYQNRDAALGIIHDITKRKHIEKIMWESVENYRTLQENLPVGLARSTIDGKIIFANPAHIKLFGYESEQEFLAGNVMDHYASPEDRNTLLNKLEAEGSVINYESQMKKRDGSLIWTSASLSAIFDNNRNIKYIDGFWKNITERKKTEETLKKSEQLYSALFQNNPIQTVVVDRNGRIIEFNKAKETSGDRMPQIGNIMYKEYAAHHKNDMHKELMECITSGEMREYPEQIYRDKILSIKISPFEEGAIITTQDITLQKKAEEELRKSEVKFRFITDNMLDLVSMCDSEDRMTFKSPSHERILGYKNNEILGRKIYEDVYPDDVAGFKEKIQLLKHSSKPDSAIYRHRHNDGHYIWLETYGHGIFTPENEYIGSIFCSRDITARKNAEEKIEHLNELLYAIKNVDQLIAHEKNINRLLQSICDCLIQSRGHMNAWIACADSGDNIIVASAPQFNSKSSAFFKTQKNINSLKCFNLIKDNSGIAIIGDIAYCEECRLVEQDQTADRMVIRLEYNNKIYGLMNVGVLPEFIHEEQEKSLLEEVAGEIAFCLYNSELEKEKKELQKQLYRSARLSAVGQLAAGIAHEFNNMLSVILGHTQLSLEEDSIDEIKQSLKEIEKTTKRGSGIVTKLAAFAKPKEPDFKNQDIHRIIDEVISLQKKQLHLDSIIVETKYNSKSKISMDRGQMEQVFLNLLINSIHAIKPKSRGKIVITTADINGEVEIRFSDNGIGMDKEVKSKVFDPFFTTKGAWAKDGLGISGTGLGLPITHSIIKQHNGTITVKSQKNKGTTFIISLPIDISSRVAEEIPAYNIPKQDIEKMKRMRILLVDDEYEMTDIFKHLFKKAEFQNFKTENNGEKVVSIFKEFKPDIVFLDIIMPQMNGEKIFKEIKTLDNTTPIVFMSGKVDFEKDAYIENGAFDYIQKPFEINQIYTILNKIRKTGDQN
ncbi:MAG: PAS domain S-box protein [Spirochaetes bacterium]|nr:PAS domain S-box protein [Spirochaetota bacterium]